jgi:hypothetical protein
VGTRRKIGGKALASGADGCVFDVRFSPDGSVEPVDGIVSKVFPKVKAAVAQNEFAILKRVNAVIPDGKGVVAGNPELKTIMDVKDEIGNKASMGYAMNACGRIVSQKERGETPFYVLEYPRVDGSLAERKRGSLSLEAFDDAITAVHTLSAAGLIHMDIAARNVFVKDDKALIGDFGNMININDEGNLLSAIQTYISKNIIVSIRDCLSANDVTSTARIAMLMFVSDDLTELKSEMKDLVAQYRDGTYQFSELYYDADQKVHPILHGPLTREMKLYLDTMYGIQDKKVIKTLMLDELKRSDIRMLAITILEKSVASDALNAKVLELWGDPHSWSTVLIKARLTALKGSKRTRRNRVNRVNRVKRVKISRKHK